MIKASGRTESGEPAFFLGITDRNVELLKAGKPILVNLAQVGGGPGHVVIFHGATDKDAVAELGKLINVAPESPEPEEQFPRGKLREDDEGAIRVAVFVRDNTIVVDFGKPVAWLGLGLGEAEALVAGLQERVTELRGRVA